MFKINFGERERERDTYADLTDSDIEEKVREEMSKWSPPRPPSIPEGHSKLSDDEYDRLYGRQWLYYHKYNKSPHLAEYEHKESIKEYWEARRESAKRSNEEEAFRNIPSLVLTDEISQQKFRELEDESSVDYLIKHFDDFDDIGDFEGIRDFYDSEDSEGIKDFYDSEDSEGIKDFYDEHESRDNLFLSATLNGNSAKLQQEISVQTNQSTGINEVSSNLQQLHSAAWNGDLESIKFLLSNGTNIEARNEWGDTPLRLAAGNNQIAVMKLLIQQGGKVNVINNKKETALHWAAWNGNTETTQLLLDSKANIEAKNEYGDTALLLAVGNNQIAAVKLLIERGAKVNAINNNGKTALQLAEQNGHQEIVNFLKELSEKRQTRFSNKVTTLFSQRQNRNETKEALAFEEIITLSKHGT